MQKRCVICGKALCGKQRRFCSRTCCGRDVNNRHKDYTAQCLRGQQRRRLLIKEHGGCCSVCGYNKNQAALVFHHTDNTEKAFNVDIRVCSNRSMASLKAETKKCILLCHNCHNELHHPNLLLSVPL